MQISTVMLTFLLLSDQFLGEETAGGVGACG